jgi:hypothetical protein
MQHIRTDNKYFTLMKHDIRGWRSTGVQGNQVAGPNSVFLSQHRRLGRYGGKMKWLQESSTGKGNCYYTYRDFVMSE